MISACASTPTTTVDDASAQRYASNQNIDRQLSDTAKAVNGSLENLLEIERGAGPADQTKTQNGVIDTTVVASHNNSNGIMNNPYSAPAPIEPPLAQNADATQNQATTELRHQVKLRWDGRVDELLYNIAKQIGFDFKVVGVTSNPPTVKIKADGVTVAQTFRMIADQLDQNTDINVITKNDENFKARTIVLIYH